MSGIIWKDLDWSSIETLAVLTNSKIHLLYFLQSYHGDGQRCLACQLWHTCHRLPTPDIGAYLACMSVFICVRFPVDSFVSGYVAHISLFLFLRNCSVESTLTWESVGCSSLFVHLLWLELTLRIPPAFFFSFQSSCQKADSRLWIRSYWQVIGWGAVWARFLPQFFELYTFIAVTH